MTATRRNLIFGAVTVAVLLILVEVLLRVAVRLSVGYLSTREEINYEYKLWQMHLFDSFMGIQQPDVDLFWRMKPNYKSSFATTNSDGFVGPEIRGKRSGEIRILFLGDSTPLGLGLPRAESSFVRQVERILRQGLPDRVITVVNASVAGYTSWQCRRLLAREGESIQPDLVITYFGNNDPSYNGYLSDRELYETMGHYGWLNRLLARSYSYQVLKSLVLRLRSAGEPERKLQARVSLADFQDNLATIKEWCDRHQCRLMLCTVPVPDLWPPGIQFKIFTTGKDSGGRLVMAADMQRDLSSRWALCLDTTLLPGTKDQWTRTVYRTSYRDAGDPADVERAYRLELTTNPNEPRLLNNLGVALWQQGKDPMEFFHRALPGDSVNPVLLYNAGVALYRTNRPLGLTYLAKARELDNYSLRIKETYNGVIRRFCSEQGAILIDLESTCKGLKDAEYFVDHCHPTPVGHKLIAEEIANFITRSQL